MIGGCAGVQQHGERAGPRRHQGQADVGHAVREQPLQQQGGHLRQVRGPSQGRRGKNGFYLALQGSVLCDQHHSLQQVQQSFKVRNRFILDYF